jgi:CubicO group peptidase (beta-lactamase class C family)
MGLPQVMSGVRRPRRLGRWAAVGAIAAIGVTWLAWDTSTDDNPSINGATYDRIDAYVQDQVDDSRIPGVAIAVVEGGAVVHAAGFGDDGHGNAITADTPFWVGSNTKSITALATMQLAEVGAVDLDTPVQTYIPQFRVADPDAAAQITVRHLLNQTSGLARIDGVRAVAEAEEDQTLEDTVADMADLELNRPVGESFEYANLNSVLLGAVIEAATGERWQDYVQSNIFDRIGMARTYTERAEAEANGLTGTHRFMFGYPVKTDGTHLAALAPSGYLYSTANDMARYLALYLQGGTIDGDQILSTAGIDEMLTGATNERSLDLQSQRFTARYGAGWFVGPFGAAADARWHQGSLPHFTGWIVLLPQTDQGVTVLINAGNQFEIGDANAAWSRIPQGIVNILREQPPPTGMSTSRFFIIFNTLAAIAITLQITTLIGLARTPNRPARWPLAWELIVAPAILLLYPGITGGLGFGTAFAFIPDLTITVIGMCGLAIITGGVRITRLLRRDRDSPSEPASPTESGPLGITGRGARSRPATPTADGMTKGRIP